MGHQKNVAEREKCWLVNFMGTESASDFLRSFAILALFCLSAMSLFNSATDVATADATCTNLGLQLRALNNLESLAYLQHPECLATGRESILGCNERSKP